MSLTPSLRRPICASCHANATSQVRHATLLRRPKKPYTFTQMITLSDGSTFLHRTTSPQPIYKSTRDTRNNILWNPSSEKLMNVEEDEAGRLRRFRARFGRGFDAEGNEEDVLEGQEGSGPSQSGESLMDMISGAGKQGEKTGKAAGVRESKKKSGKGKGGEK